MKKKFNITGVCVQDMHYMVDISKKIENILNLINEREYFSINRPRQYGKTTTFFNLFKELEKHEDYICIKISFEGLGVESYKSSETFIPQFLNLLNKSFKFQKLTLFFDFLSKNKNIFDWENLSDLITDLCLLTNKKLVLMIDEVDKSMNNQLFLDFLAMLRNKYLNQNEGTDSTFHNVILAGVHDVRTLKLKINPNSEQKNNSPWNIATDFTIDLSFNPHEISTMLVDYQKDKNVEMDIEAISNRIYYYTSGYPFLVSKVCKEIDENILPFKTELNWTLADVEESVKRIIREDNTNFQSMVNNLENNKNLFDFIEKLILGSEKFTYTATQPTIYLAYQYGIIDHKNNIISIHNKIYQEVISDYMVNKFKIESKNNFVSSEAITSRYLTDEGKLILEKVLLKFQEVIKQKYSKSEVLKSDEFLEKDLRLLFLVFLQPIINGIGFSFKEVETGAEKKMDIVIVFEGEKFIIELKLWYGESYHKKGLQQLKNYMKLENVTKGFMLIMDKTRSKEFTNNMEEDIMMVWV